MESPSSIRRVTRSQFKSSLMNTNNTIPISRKIEESNKVGSKQRTANLDRSALMDISNDSPIVGLASGSLMGTPSSLVKKRNQPKQDPGSGEALLRGQVKILLQKVEEEGEIPKGFLGSGLVAPTPTNTPQVHNLFDITGFSCEISSTEAQKDSEIHHQDEMVFDESEKSDVTRALLFDFLDKSEVSDGSSCLSVLTEGSVCVADKSAEEDDASVWSIQVNTSMQDEDEEAGEIAEGYDETYDESYENGEELDELCEGLSNMFVQKKPLPEFEGKHTRFLYNNDDEIEGEEVVLRFKGMSTPQGKHLRFQDEDESEI
ncbi:hypothetical protein ACHQM5_002494 [Ranunculus cassubicifolius]